MTRDCAGIPHGTTYRYRGGCRCVDCCAAMRRDAEFRGHTPCVDEWDSPASEARFHARSHGIPEGSIISWVTAEHDVPRRRRRHPVGEWS